MPLLSVIGSSQSGLLQCTNKGWAHFMAASMHHNCRIEYRAREIVIRGPAREARQEAHRIVQRFACSAMPYRLASVDEDEVVLRPV